MQALIVGDPHIVPHELQECLNFEQLVLDILSSSKVDSLIVLGDLFHNHAILNTTTIEYWNIFIEEVLKVKTINNVILLVGNHDFYSPTIQDPHALISISKSNKVYIIDKPLVIDSIGFMPYYAEPTKFLEDATKFKSDIEGLVCHQTFDGAKYLDGFYAKDAVNPVALPFKYIISGHLHSAHAFNNVWYPGSPRWRTLLDANQDKFIYIVELNETSFKIIKEIPTYPTCKRIFRIVDQEGENVVLPDATENTDFRVDVYGSQEYVSKKIFEYKASLNARCRPFPTRVKQRKITESDGILTSFRKYATNFTPPNSTDINILIKESENRLNG